MSDLISRKWLMECVDEGWIKFDTEKDTNKFIHLVRDTAPSAQPEIIRCRDCKHWMPYDWMFSEVWKSKNIEDYQEEEIGCVYCDMNMSANDFCSRGEKKMSEHITKQEALQAIDDIYDNCEAISFYLSSWKDVGDKIRSDYGKVRNFINNMPQYIIRCQDCKYGEFPAHNVRCSQFYGAGCYNGFCAWGEKK